LENECLMLDTPPEGGFLGLRENNLRVRLCSPQVAAASGITAHKNI